MHKFIELVERFHRIVAENIARSVERKEFLRVFFGGVFAALMAFTLKPAVAFGASTTWCGTNNDYRTCGCNPPGPYCGSLGYSCSSSTKCPSGCTLNTKYYSTGCWCATNSTCKGTYVCCDCWCGGKECGCAHYMGNV